MKKQKGFVIPTIIAVVAILIVSGGVYLYKTKKVEAPVNNLVASSTITNKWTSFEINPSIDGPNFKITYPEGWGVTDLSFSICDNFGLVTGVLSPSRSDLPGSKGVSVSYLVQYCVSADKYIVAFQGFIKVPLNHMPTESDKILLSDNDLKDMNEYKIAQQIISTSGFVINSSLTIATSTIVGGDKDIHGCFGSSGYSWCEVKNKCLRILEESCEIDKTQPSISSIIPTSGSIGTNVELTGYNLLSNRGDQNLMIENSSGEKASLGFGNPTHLNTSENYVSMKFVIPEKVCKKVATDAALPCNDWMNIVPGEYKIHVVGPTTNYFVSNKVKFTIINPSLKIISPNGGETYNTGENIPVKFSINGNVDGGVYMELVDSFGNVVSDNITGLGVGGPDLKDWNGLYNLSSTKLSEGKYKIYISTYGKDVGNVEDYSDSFFTIVKYNNIIGGDKDINGCIGSAGYSWCEVKNKCLRIWEEKCGVVLTATTTDEIKDWKTYKDEEYGFEFKYPNDWEINEDISYINVFNPNTIEANKPDTDQFREAVVLTFTEKTCLDSDWKIGFSLIYYKKFCISNGSLIINIDMGAFTDKTKTIEDKILSTFKFTK